MSNEKHTWSISKYGSLVDANGVAFANFTKSPINHQDMKAKADLIVSAPDLLAAMEGLCKKMNRGDIQEWDDAWDAAFDAISKAKGLMK